MQSILLVLMIVIIAASYIGAIVILLTGLGREFSNHEQRIKMRKKELMQRAQQLALRRYNKTAQPSANNLGGPSDGSRC